MIYINDLRTRMTETNQLTGGLSRAQPLVLLETFDGDGNFTNWMCHFESVSAVNRWSDDNKILWLWVKLMKKAHMVYSWLSHQNQQSYATTKESLSQRFEPPSKQQLYKVEFESRQRRGKESWADFGNDLMLLASKAFPRLKDETREKLALSK